MDDFEIRGKISFHYREVFCHEDTGTNPMEIHDAMSANF